MQSHPDPVWPMPPPTNLESRGQGQGGDRLALASLLDLISLGSPSITNIAHGSRSSPETCTVSNLEGSCPTPNASSPPWPCRAAECGRHAVHYTVSRLEPGPKPEPTGVLKVASNACTVGCSLVTGEPGPNRQATCRAGPHRHLNQLPIPALCPQCGD